MDDSNADVAPAVDALLEGDALAETDIEAVRERARSRGGLDDEATIDAVEEPTGPLLELLGRTHALAVLREVALEPGPQRFTDLEEELSISPSTLSTRLSEFVDAGLLERERHDEVPPRVEYRPTERTDALAPLFVYLHLWAERYGLE